jgi:hypothetical protein
LGAARLSAADSSSRADDCRSAAGFAKLGPACIISGQASRDLARMGWSGGGASGFAGSDVGLASDARRAGRQFARAARNLGLAGRSRGPGSELGRATSRIAPRCAPSVMGRSYRRIAIFSARVSAGPIVGSARCAGTVMGWRSGRSCRACRTRVARASCRSFMGRAAACRAGKAGCATRDVVESARSRVGSAEAHGAGPSGTRFSRLGRASFGGGAAGDGSAVVGSDPGCGFLGCSEDAGACSPTRAVMVGARRTRGGTCRCSSALERTGSDRCVVSPGAGACSACSSA